MSYMTTSRSQSVNSSQTIYAGYLCSYCANPVITRLTSRVIQSGNTGLLGTTADNLSDQVSAGQSKQTSMLLEYLASPKTGNYPEGKIEGMDSPCPVCGNMEPWQRKDLLWKIEASGPVMVFLTLQDGYAWAQRILRARKNAVETAMTDDAVMQSGLKRLHEIDDELRSYEAEKSSGEAAKEFASLRAKEAALNERLDSMSAFSREKKQLKEDLDQCRAALAESESRYHAVVASEEAKASKLIVEKARLMLYGKELANHAVLHENKYGLAISLATDEDETGKSVSLAALPEVGKHVVSEFEKNNQQLMQAVKILNDALLATQKKEENE